MAWKIRSNIRTIAFTSFLVELVLWYVVITYGAMQCSFLASRAITTMQVRHNGLSVFVIKLTF